MSAYNLGDFSSFCSESSLAPFSLGHAEHKNESRSLRVERRKLISLINYYCSAAQNGEMNLALLHTQQRDESSRTIYSRVSEKVKSNITHGIYMRFEIWIIPPCSFFNVQAKWSNLLNFFFGVIFLRVFLPSSSSSLLCSLSLLSPRELLLLLLFFGETKAG